MAVLVQGQQVTFTPPAGAMGLIGDMTDWRKRSPLPTREGKPLTLRFPRGAWVEYAWVDASGEAFADPDNPQKSLNPWWTYPRAVEVGQYTHHPLWSLPETNRRGDAHRLTWLSQVFPGKRRAVVHLPHGYSGEALPVYYVQDGIAFYRTGRLSELLDRSVAAGQVSSAALVFVEPGDRNQEYYLNDRYLDFLRQEVFPRVEGELLKVSERGLWGASLGGLISLYLGSQHPALFQRVVSHSGAFIAAPGAQYASGVIDTTTAPEWLREQLSQRPPKHLRLSLDTGTLEWLAGPNRRMAAALADARLPHQYREYASGHNWVTWRQALPEALLYMQGSEQVHQPAAAELTQLQDDFSAALRDLRREGNLSEEEIRDLVQKELSRPL